MTTATIAANIKSTPDPKEITRAMRLFLPPGQVTEIRVLDGTTAQDRYPQVYSGYFDNPEAIAPEVMRMKSAKGVYFIPNQIDPSLIARSVNKLRPAKKEPLTSDANIIRRVWLLVDCDANRGSGISATDEEHAAALDRARLIRDAMKALGWAEPIYGSSGNGAHLEFWIDLPAEDGGLVERVLKELSRRFGDDVVKVDTSVANPARIWKLPGTLACKGDANGAAYGRPHRPAYLIDVPKKLEIVTAEQLNAFVTVVKESRAESPRAASPNRSKGTPFNLADFIRRHNIDARGPKVNAQGATVYVLPVCPWNPDHTNESAFLMQHASGALSAGCHHESCKANGWTEYRAIYEAPRPKFNGKSIPQNEPLNPDPEVSAQQAVLPPSDGTRLILDPADPLTIARLFRASCYAHPDCSTLVFNADEFHEWHNKYEVVESAELRKKLYEFLETAQKYVWRGKEQSLDAFQPNKYSVDGAIDALKAVAYHKGASPCWLLDKPNLPPPAEIIAGPNYLLHLRKDGNPVIRGVPTPAFFSPFALDYDIVERAPKPKYWWKFLNELWGDDSQSIELLQEWFGYVLTLDTSLQKILLLIGPTRSGKGTIARILTAMIGAANVCGPTLSGLATNFGLQSLLYKQLAIVSDARLSGRTDQAIITERLLAASGDDAIEVHRKNRGSVTKKLPTRFMIISNELPRLTDTSGALANRFIVLMLNNSFLGNEDTELTEKLITELPAILLWAIGGWQRLKKRGHFLQPDSSNEAVDEMKDLGSPIQAFIRDWCVVEPIATIAPKELFEGWRFWCEDQGKEKSGSLQVFGRDLRAALPAIRMTQPNTDGERERRYSGIRLCPERMAHIAHEKMVRQQRKQGGQNDTD